MYKAATTSAYHISDEKVTGEDEDELNATMEQRGAFDKYINAMYPQTTCKAKKKNQENTFMPCEGGGYIAR